MNRFQSFTVLLNYLVLRVKVGWNLLLLPKMSRKVEANSTDISEWTIESRRLIDTFSSSKGFYEKFIRNVNKILGLIDGTGAFIDPSYEKYEKKLCIFDPNFPMSKYYNYVSDIGATYRDILASKEYDTELLFFYFLLQWLWPKIEYSTDNIVIRPILHEDCVSDNMRYLFSSPYKDEKLINLMMVESKLKIQRDNLALSASNKTTFPTQDTIMHVMDNIFKLIKSCNEDQYTAQYIPLCRDNKVPFKKNNIVPLNEAVVLNTITSIEAENYFSAIKNSIIEGRFVNFKVTDTIESKRTYYANFNNIAKNIDLTIKSIMEPSFTGNNTEVTAVVDRDILDTVVTNVQKWNRQTYMRGPHLVEPNDVIREDFEEFRLTYETNDFSEDNEGYNFREYWDDLEIPKLAVKPSDFGSSDFITRRTKSRLMSSFVTNPQYKFDDTVKAAFEGGSKTITDYSIPAQYKTLADYKGATWTQIEQVNTIKGDKHYFNKIMPYLPNVVYWNMSPTERAVEDAKPLTDSSKQLWYVTKTSNDVTAIEDWRFDKYFDKGHKARRRTSFKSVIHINSIRNLPFYIQGIEEFTAFQFNIVNPDNILEFIEWVDDNELELNALNSTLFTTQRLDDVTRFARSLNIDRGTIVQFIDSLVGAYVFLYYYAPEFVADTITFRKWFNKNAIKTRNKLNKNPKDRTTALI